MHIQRLHNRARATFRVSRARGPSLYELIQWEEITGRKAVQQAVLWDRYGSSPKFACRREAKKEVRMAAIAAIG
jgi:hypothetical protein